MKKCIKKINRIKQSLFRFARDKKLFLLIISGVLLSFIVNNALAIDPTSDILSGAQADIKTNFGTSSTVMLIVYIVEIFAGISAYIKTKNLFALIGLVVVVLFTYIAFGLI